MSGFGIWTSEPTLGGSADVDVITTPPADGDTIVWDDTTEMWVPGTPVAGSSSTLDLHVVSIAADALHWSVSPHAVPMAVWDTEQGWTWITFLKAGGDLWLTYYDHATGTVADPEMVASYPFSSADLHMAPAVFIDHDGRVHIIYSGHNAEAHRHYRMVNPRDMTAWTTTVLDGGTYAMGVMTAGGDLIFLDRHTTHDYGDLYRLPAGSTTWNAAVTAVDTAGAAGSHNDFYQGDAVWTGSRMAIVWTITAASTHNGTKDSLFYAEYDPATDIWYDAAGTSLGTSPLTYAEFATACLAATVATSQYLRMALAHHQGAPVIAYLADGEAGAIGVVRWTGSAWVDALPIDPGVTMAEMDQIGLASTPDELLLFAPGGTSGGNAMDFDLWRYVDHEWVSGGTLLEGTTDRDWSGVRIVHGGGPALAVTMEYDYGTHGWPGNNNTVVGELVLVTRWWPGVGASVDHSHDYAASDHTHAADGHTHTGRWEVVVSGNPGGAVTTADGTDWLYTFVED